MPESISLIAALDLNDQAAILIRRAGRLAAQCQARLVLAHVVDFHGGYESDHVPFLTPAQVQDQMVRHARVWLLGLVHHLEVPEVEILVRAGAVVPVLADLALARNARYLVVGTGRWGPFGKLASLVKDTRLSAAGCELISLEPASRPASRGPVHGAGAWWAGCWAWGGLARAAKRLLFAWSLAWCGCRAFLNRPGPLGGSVV